MLFDRRRHGRVHNIFRMVHLTICILTGFITCVCHALESKSDTAAIDFLSFFQGIVGLVCYGFHVNRQGPNEVDRIRLDGMFHRGGTSAKSDDVNLSVNDAEEVSSKRRSRRTWANRAVISFDICFLVVHACLLVLFTSGSIQMALLYRYTNP